MIKIGEREAQKGIGKLESQRKLINEMEYMELSLAKYNIISSLETKYNNGLSFDKVQSPSGYALSVKHGDLQSGCCWCCARITPWKVSF